MSWRMRAWTRQDQGAASVLVVAVAGVLLLVGAALGTSTAMVTAHRRAQAAADLAALAGAGTLAHGGSPCPSAASVAQANGVRMTSCRADGADVLVVVEADGPHWLGQTHDLDARARAGPGP